MNINFTFIVFQYSSGFRLEFELFKEIQLNSLNQIDVENTLINVPKLNMHVGLETVETQYKQVGEKKNFVECQENTLGKNILCRVSECDTRQRHAFAECLNAAFDINNASISYRWLLTAVCRVLYYVERWTLDKEFIIECLCMPSVRLSTKSLFTECFCTEWLCYDTR